MNSLTFWHLGHSDIVSGSGSGGAGGVGSVNYPDERPPEEPGFQECPQGFYWDSSQNICVPMTAGYDGAGGSAGGGGGLETDSYAVASD